MVEAILLPKVVVERARREASKLGVTIDEYFLELVSQGLDPRERSIDYLLAAEDLIQQAKAELGGGNVRQAAEKTWGAAALAIKAYAFWREGRRLASHRELWEYVEVLASELGGWVRNAWNEAAAMHVCFYEGWCKLAQVEAALISVEKLVGEIAARVKRGAL